MRAMLRLPLLPAALLLMGAPPVGAQWQPADPVAPAVIGRALDQIGPVRPARPAKAPVDTAAGKPFADAAAPATWLEATVPAAGRQPGQAPAARPLSAKAPAAAPVEGKRPAATALPAKPQARPQLAAKPAAAAPLASKAAPAAAVAAVAAPKPAAVVAAQPAPAAQRLAKQAADDRVDPNLQLEEVGKGTRFARKPLGEGAYFADRHRSAARKYYEQHPVMRPAVKWKIGEPVPPDAVVAQVPGGLLATLPQLPPGHAYVELGGDVVLVAAGSRMVVDGISRAPTETALLTR